MMALSVSKDPERRYAFLKRRRIPKVPKCKLNEVSSGKGWDVCSLGFDESIISSPRKRSRFANKFSSSKDKNLTNGIRENPECEDQSRENYFSERRWKYLKQKSVLLNIENIQSEFTVHRKRISSICDDNSFQIENDSSQTQSNHPLASHHRTKQNASVLLKVKDIQESFLNDKSLICFKPFSSENLNLSSVSNLEQRNDYKMIFSHPGKFSDFSTVFSTDYLNFSFGNNQKLVDSSALPLKKQGLDVSIPLKSANNLPVMPELKSVIKEICDNLNVENLDKHKNSDYNEQFHILSTENVKKYKEGDCTNKQLHNGPESKATAILESKSSGKGSNWVHTLKWTEACEKNESTDCSDQAGKKSLKNLVQGGFAEQLLKLQRLELSDKVIWNHKFHKRKKDFCNILNLKITAVSYFGDLVVTKCILLNSHASFYNNARNKFDLNCEDSETEHSNTISAHVNNVVSSFNENEQSLDSKMFCVLFRRNLFCKQQLKVRETFQLFEPWLIISLTSVPFPVILNTYFIEPQKFQPVKDFACPQYNEHEIPDILKTVQHSNVCAIQKNIPSLDEQMLFFSRWKYVTLTARVQRIWENKISSRRRENCISLEDHTSFSFSLLLQTQDGIFCELCIKSNFLYLQTLWSEIIENGEGKCYTFRDLLVTHRYHCKKYLQLFQVIHALSQKQTHYEHFPVPVKKFCYQFMPSPISCVTALDDEISQEKFPMYCNFDIQPLSMFQKVAQGDRFTCIGKILLEFKNEYYITDESLLNMSSKYVKIKFAPSFQIDDSVVGSVVLLKEAVFDEDCLEIDKYCRFIILAKSAKTAGSVKLPSATLARIKEFASVNLLHVVSPLHLCSNLSDLVIVEGIIKHVDENEAMSWLECSFCFKDNLLQDANSIIYCEDCSHIVPKPILNVKMEVIICDQNVPSSVVKIQLLPLTIKSILQISEDIFQPQCSVTDVLGKKIGPLCCYITASEKSGEKKIFHLTEIQSDVS